MAEHRATQAASELGYLSTSELDFREEVIYFVIVDRFYDATSDEEELAGLWDRGEKEGLYDKMWLHWGKYWGGNLDGIIQKVPYLKELGVTAVWLSPLFEQVDDMQFDRAPMHGYWTKDFRRINPRFIRHDDCNTLDRSSTLADLVAALHGAGLKLILDVVCNHSSPDINGSKGKVFDDGKLIADFYHDDKNFYYHYPEITDWDDEFQLIHGEMAGLATFNEKNIDFRNFIKSAIKSWIDVGVDALRVDTLKHMPIWFWQEFTSDMKAHRANLFMFGEYGFGKPWDPRTVAYANDTGMSILDFGLCDAIRFAFSGQQSGGFRLVEYLLSFDYVYKRANELVTFIDNHDMPRFLSICPDERMLEMATVLLFSLRGVPCLFYGTEQYLVNNTDGGQDPYNRPMMASFDTDSRLFKLVAAMSRLRRTVQALSLGGCQERFLSEDIYIFERRYRDSWALCLFNKGEQATITVKHLTIPDGQHQCVISGESFPIRDGSLVDLQLKPASMHVLVNAGSRVCGQTVAVFQLNGVETRPGQSLCITGDCPELGEWDLSKAYGLEYVNRNTWIAEVPFTQTAGEVIHCKFVILNADESFEHENLVRRTLLLPSDGRVKFDCVWGYC
ncbi:alpha-amylase family glycosyl hydrolase [Cyanobium sp. CH-040]|uniref:alpha-amylase family glycosyl hydrolase n=1 Tax=Cyanobium sp. CH-040 TaxID=2823708 RepID=UPI0020CF1A95|nr:alpha-amylase family glycosyl hydrolase [Cyanobium sp. CH-040]MCP9928611.1 cyclomaltodextrin glucanotransferase [Cyanobium sp. CH-040]